ncbi:MAG: PhzF family phenazine biosynthesis protein [Rickettsiales bacterium]|nr:PhzF family phenazine biosynthesis protein [Rickettsiales bacterium]
MKTYAVSVISAFGTDTLQGNPAGVCLMEAFAPDAMLQDIAAQMNLAETAFTVARGENSFELRWFTPTMEVDLCGHATLATAHALVMLGRVDADLPILFHTRSGILTAHIEDAAIALELPLQPGVPLPMNTQFQACFAPPILFAQRNDGNYLVEVATAAEVNDCTPDLRAIRALEAEGIIITAKGEMVDYVYRYFAPAIGIDEDPVTGSANGQLAPYWSARLGKENMVAHQLSAEGGELHVAMHHSHVRVSGQVRSRGARLIESRHTMKDQCGDVSDGGFQNSRSAAA